MKAVLISIQPKWCELIASGEKTVEVRKNKPMLQTPFKVYVYQTKMKWAYALLGKLGLKNLAERLQISRGKVIGEFICDDILQLFLNANGGYYFPVKGWGRPCMTHAEARKYGCGFPLYAWHISNLYIYGEPKELSEFWSADKCPYASQDGCTYKYHCFRCGQKKRCGSRLKRPPQSWRSCRISCWK